VTEALMQTKISSWKYMSNCARTTRTVKPAHTGNLCLHQRWLPEFRAPLCSDFLSAAVMCFAVILPAREVVHKDHAAASAGMWRQRCEAAQQLKQW
jgi:hypothetical protein